MNLLKNVLQNLDDNSLGLLGAVLGENEGKVRDGRELRDTDASVASNFSQQLYYKDSQSLVANGYDQLDGLMGAETNRLVQAVGREADLGSTAAKRLVGAVSPMVFATVANEMQSKKLSISELGDLIAVQSLHLDKWDRQNSDNFSSASKGDEENAPLFKSLPKDDQSDQSRWNDPPIQPIQHSPKQIVIAIRTPSVLELRRRASSALSQPLALELQLLPPLRRALLPKNHLKVM